MTNAYPAKIRRVIDGDTIDLVIDLGFRITTVQRIRLIDVDTPERGHPDWAAATAYTQEWVMLAAGAPPANVEWPFVIETKKGDAFGRWLGRLYNWDESRCLNDELIAQNIATLWVRNR